MSFVGVGIIGILTLLLGLFFFLLHIAVCVWGYRRKGRRICDPGCAGLVVLPVVGLIIYLLIRNNY